MNGHRWGREVVSWVSWGPASAIWFARSSRSLPDAWCCLCHATFVFPSASSSSSPAQIYTESEKKKKDRERESRVRYFGFLRARANHRPKERKRRRRERQRERELWCWSLRAWPLSFLSRSISILSKYNLRHCHNTFALSHEIPRVSTPYPWSNHPRASTYDRRPSPAPLRFLLYAHRFVRDEWRKNVYPLAR